MTKSEQMTYSWVITENFNWVGGGGGSSPKISIERVVGQHWKFSSIGRSSPKISINLGGRHWKFIDVKYIYFVFEIIKYNNTKWWIRLGVKYLQRNVKYFFIKGVFFILSLSIVISFFLSFFLSFFGVFLWLQ
jgi:hypothetical protein